MTERHGSAEAFRRALEQRLKNAAQASSRTLLRERQVLLFERFLVRASAADGVELVVKRGWRSNCEQCAPAPRRTSTSA